MPKLHWGLRRRAVATVVAAGLALSACGGDSVATDVPPPEVLPEDLLPKRVLDLRMTPEDTDLILEGRSGSFFEAAGLYGFRRGKLLQATLQVSRFNDKARPEEEDFRDALALQIATTTPQKLKMNNQTVYVSLTDRQGIAIWFFDESMFVLSTREEFEKPRALLRELIGTVS